MNPSQPNPNGRTVLLMGVGYLGRRLAPLLTDRSSPFSTVWGTTRSPRRIDDLKNLGLVPVLYDVVSASEMLPAVDTVLHCVGFDRTGSATRREVYVDGLQKTLENLPDSCQHFHYVSSTGVYGDAQGDWVDELAEPDPGDEGGQVCWEAERLLQQSAHDRGMTLTIYRLAGIYGPDRMIGARMLESGHPVPGNPDQTLNLIHVDDAAHILYHACLKSPTHRLYNVSDGTPPTREDFYHEVAQLIHVDPPTFDPDQSGRMRGDRKIQNRRLMEDFELTLQFPTYREGLRNCMSKGSFD